MGGGEAFEKKKACQLLSTGGIYDSLGLCGSKWYRKYCRRKEEWISLIINTSQQLMYEETEAEKMFSKITFKRYFPSAIKGKKDKGSGKKLEVILERTIMKC